MKNYKLLPKIALWSLFGLGVAFTLLFFLGGDMAEGHEVAGKTLPIPTFSNAFLIWVYILFGIGILVTLYSAGVNFAFKWKYNRPAAYTLLGVLAGIVCLFVLCWFIGSGEKVEIIGYDGSDNVGFWPQLADMVIYACYFLVAVTLGTIIWGIIYTSRKK